MRILRIHGIWATAHLLLLPYVLPIPSHIWWKLLYQSKRGRCNQENDLSLSLASHPMVSFQTGERKGGEQVAYQISQPSLVLNCTNSILSRYNWEDQSTLAPTSPYSEEAIRPGCVEELKAFPNHTEIRQHWVEVSMALGTSTTSDQ